jgi:nucleotide-binding universal stress UspA family protein/nitrite reductase/ring-hydroxylating ferredoxin subunit
MAFETILVGTDGSETAQVAELAAASLAAALGSRLVIVSAHGGEAGAKDSALKTVEEARGRAQRAGVEATSEVAEGEPAPVIVELADRGDADLVVLGDVGMGQAKRLRLGGVPDRVSHTAPCNLLIVRTSEHAGETDWSAYRSILIATAGSPTAAHAARLGAELAKSLGAQITLVHVGDELLGKVVLKSTAERLGDADIPVRTATGDPGTAIVQVAKEGGHDLVVVGNKGMGGTGRLLGSVPNTVSHAAGCDVLIVRTVGRSLADLKPGEGAIVMEGGKKIAGYRSESGEVTTLLPKCKHLGCTVGWNSTLGTWDCPCHGSRYAADGKVIRGPSQRDLDKIEI